jgi:hypothetical protein
MAEKKITYEEALQLVNELLTLKMLTEERVFVNNIISSHS